MTIGRTRCQKSGWTSLDYRRLDFTSVLCYGERSLLMEVFQCQQKYIKKSSYKKLKKYMDLDIHMKTLII